MMTTKSGLSGLFLFLLFSGSVSVLGSVVRKAYAHVSIYYRWQAAQTYCSRLNSFVDLATMSTQSDANKLTMLRYYAWIGLYKKDGEWIWTDGSEGVIPLGNQNSDKKCAFVLSTDKRFYVGSCGKRCFFFCRNHDQHESDYIFVPKTMTWSDARQYCKEHFSDLATFPQSFPLSSAADYQDFPAWIGLHRDEQTWTWSTGSYKYRQWASGEPRDTGDCVTITSRSKKMATQNCSDRLPFICFSDNLVLVKENKTWIEALEHCLLLKKKLVSVQPGDDHGYMMSRMREATTDKMWVGLRFLAGHWMWMNEVDMSYSDLLSCPPTRQRCGALSKKSTGSLEPTDCLEKLNFMCYT